MFRTIVVPLDGSPLAEHALATATMLAERAKAEVHLVRAYQLFLHDLGDEWPLDQAMRDETQEYLDRAAQGIQRETGIRPTTALLAGQPAQSICEYVRGVKDPLLVMSTHGRTGFSRAWMGSVADGVVRTATNPVLLLRPDEAPDGLLEPIGVFERMLVPVDGSSYSEQIVAPAMELAELTAARVLLLEVVKPVYVPAYASMMEYPASYAPAEDYATETTHVLVQRAAEYISNLAIRLRRQYAVLDIQTEVRTDNSPATTILDTARAQGADLVALATHGRGMSRLMVGSVADKVLRGGPRALLVVRPQ
ncbi:MAG TPA: universal stress protein [Gemmatimonadaceae bacterium]|nr:universal stress protein [Gemmatimonadaceae bacterium]